MLKSSNFQKRLMNVYLKQVKAFQFHQKNFLTDWIWETWT